MANCPALPPGFRRDASPSPPPAGPKPRIGPIGPMLPPSVTVGPSLPGPGPHYDAPKEEEEEQVDSFNVIGPLPPSGGVSAEDERSERLAQIEERAQNMKRKLLGEEEPAAEPAKAARPEWMEMLPEGKRKPTAVTARTFRPNSTQSLEIDSSWAETPAQRKQRESDKAAKRAPPAAAPVGPPPPVVSSEPKRESRGPSLLDQHRSKLKELPEETGRKAFNRETDLSSRPTAAKERIANLSSGGMLQSKFSRGSK
eukprot:m.94579 g.94579  ORF g.94579 m.94579 type:complete len:255 (-) comp13863_c3_seq1:303-1067(-)